jgi:hypothetical protein
MEPHILESDWKCIQKLHPVVRERFCQRILDEIAGIHADSTKTFHQRYLAVYECVQRQDKEIASMMNGLTRSTAKLKFGIMCAQGLVTDDELAGLSQDMQDFILSCTNH